jgi:type I restriction enzyme, S subunit
MVAKVKWPTKRLGDLAEFRNGVNYSKSSFGEGVKVVGVSAFQDYTKPRYAELERINPEGIVTKRNILRDDDIVFVRSNGNRELISRSLFIEQPPEEVTHSAFTIRLRFTSHQVHPKFYAYCFRTPLVRHGLTAQGGGTSINNLNQDILNALEVPFPPLPVQRRIGGILSAYDELMENSLRRIRILEAMACALYREWFVYFRFPGHEKLPLAASPLGDIPRGWAVRPLVEVATITMGLSPKRSTYNEQGDGTPLVNGPVEFGERFTKQRKWTTAPTKWCWEGDLVVCVRGSTTGRNVKSDDVYCLGRGVCGLSSKHQCFVDLLFENELPTLLGQASGSTFPSWTGPQLKSHPVLSPPLDLLARFETLVKPMSAAVLRYSRKIQNLRRTRDVLLPRLLSGKVNFEERNG